MSEQTEAEMLVEELAHSPDLIHKLQRLLGLRQLPTPSWPLENEKYASCFVGNWKVEIVRDGNAWSVHLAGGPFFSAEDAKAAALIAAQSQRAN